MIEVTDLKEICFESSDLGDLRTLLRQLIGQPFRFFRVSYGDELRLHLGSLVELPNPRTKRLLRGSYVLGARSSAWFVTSAPRSMLLASDDVHVRTSPGPNRVVDIRQIEVGNYISPGAIVVGVMADLALPGFILNLLFNDGSTVFIGPNFEEPKDEADEAREIQEGEPEVDLEISDWELLTPHSRILRSGPGGRWCYLDSNLRKSD